MKIVALFGLRTYEPSLPELLVAWDEYAVDGNGGGWQDAKVKAIAAIGDDLLTLAEVSIEVAEANILSILGPIGTIKGEVTRSGPL